MNLTSPSQVRALLADLDIHPSKTLGQSFLIDKNILNILIKTANLSHDDEVLEVGPGLGVVTEQLLRRVRRVVAVEKDSRLFDFLKERFEAEPALELICTDMLDVDVNNRLRSGLNKVVSNLPFSVGSRILVDLVRAEPAPRQIVVTVQQEVAHRLAARPGSRDYGLSSVWSQLVYQVDMVKTVSPGCFWPKPEVKSAIVNMRKHNRFILSPEEKQIFYQLTKQAFTHRRKQLATILKCMPDHLNMSLARARRLLEELEIDIKSRPENLAVEDWCKLARKTACLSDAC